MNLPNSKWNITDMVFEKIWSSMIDFMNLIRHLKPIIAIEWPAHCVYWKFQRVEMFCEKHQLMRFTFDGCMVGIVDKDDNPITKPWAILTDCHELGKMFDGLFCDGSHHHVHDPFSVSCSYKTIKSIATFTLCYTHRNVLLQIPRG